MLMPTFLAKSDSEFQWSFSQDNSLTFTVVRGFRIIPTALGNAKTADYLILDYRFVDNWEDIEKWMRIVKEISLTGCSDITKGETRLIFHALRSLMVEASRLLMPSAKEEKGKMIECEVQLNTGILSLKCEKYNIDICHTLSSYEVPILTNANTYTLV